MDACANFVHAFIGLFQEDGKTFLGLAGGILPTLIALMTAVNALIKFVGQERINNIAQVAGRYTILRYPVSPVLPVFFLTNPMDYTFGRFRSEKYKPAFYDAAVSVVHSIVGLFPHANPAELFVYMGIAQGIEQLGFPLGQIAIRYSILGVIVILIRGIVTETLTFRMMRQRDLI